MRGSDGTTYDFTRGPDGDFAFRLPYLTEHRQTLGPVVVSYEAVEDGSLVATGIDDA